MPLIKSFMKKVGDGTRILNFMVDGFLVFWLSFFAFRFWNFYVIYWHFKPINFWWFVAAMLFVYYALFEALFARTPGKWITGTKVVDLHGNPPSVSRVLLRTALRLIIIDFLFNAIWGKPLHDYCSRTMVVEI